MVNTSPSLAFIACIERGYLESQSILLFESIRQYGGRFSNCSIYAVAPRKGRDVSAHTKQALERLEVEYIDTALNRDFTFYRYGNKTFACAYIEQKKQYDFLVFLDSDTLFFQEPNQLELCDRYDVAVRPVSWKSVCTTGSADDPYDQYWRAMCELCEVDYDHIPLLKTAIGGTSIKACYNAGLVAVRGNKGIFEKWRDDFVTTLSQGLAPKNSNLWGSDQTTLSTAIWGLTERVQILDPSYNYPIRKNGEVGSLQKLNHSQDLIHIHYHNFFESEHLPNNPLFQPEFSLETTRKEWLLKRIPLSSR